jgi:hypothetical protein
MVQEIQQERNLNAELVNSFANVQNKTEINEVIRELFDEKKLYMIADMSKEEIRIATRIKIIADMKGIRYWNEGLEFYTKFLLSNSRKSRKEILEAIKGYTRKPNLFDRLLGRNPYMGGGMY